MKATTESTSPPIAVCRRGEPDFPRGLEDLHSPPKQLYWIGRSWPPPFDAVALVGSRSASPYGLEVASTLAADLARAGVAVVSGLARGVDAAAHRGALEAGGISLAVLAASPATPYPPESAGLHRKLIERGAVFAEFPAGTRLRRGLFVRRNRIVAGLCRGVVVVEAGRASGALSTAREAAAIGRFVAAVPGDVTRETALGCLNLLRGGAVAVGSAADVLSALRGSGPAGAAAAEEVGVGKTSIDEMALRTGRSAAAVQAELTVLELIGVVRRDPRGRLRHSGDPPE